MTFLSQPLISGPLAGPILEAFRDGFESGEVDEAEGGKWPTGIIEGRPLVPNAQTAIKHAGAYGIELPCGQLDPGLSWSTSDTNGQEGPKVGVTVSSFDTPANYSKTSSVYMQEAHFIPADYPDLSAGSAMANYLILTQFKGTLAGKLNPILNVVLGRDVAQGDPLGTFRLSTHVRPGSGAARQFVQGAIGICPVADWFFLTQLVVPHLTLGEWHGWIDGQKAWEFTGMDTVSDLDSIENIVTCTSCNGYIFYPYNNVPIGSTVEGFELYGDTNQIWGVVASGGGDGDNGTTTPTPTPIPVQSRAGGRNLTPEVLDYISRTHNDSADLMYFGFEDGAIHIALHPHDVRFQRPGFFVGVDPSGDVTEQIWQGVGGAIIPGPVVESPEFNEQGQDVQFAVIDPGFDFLGRILNARQFMRRYEYWRVYFHTSGPEAGKIATGWKLCGGYLNGGWDVEDANDENGLEPGTTSVKFRVTSPLGLIGQLRRSIQTNERSHSKWFEGDRFMDQVKFVQHRRLFFGEAAPDAATGGRVD